MWFEILHHGDLTGKMVDFVGILLGTSCVANERTWIVISRQWSITHLSPTPELDRLPREVCPGKNNWYIFHGTRRNSTHRIFLAHPATWDDDDDDDDDDDQRHLDLGRWPQIDNTLFFLHIYIYYVCFFLRRALITYIYIYIYILQVFFGCVCLKLGCKVLLEKEHHTHTH